MDKIAVLYRFCSGVFRRGQHQPVYTAGESERKNGKLHFKLLLHR